MELIEIIFLVATPIVGVYIILDALRDRGQL
jgi:hypothetical protein